MDNSQNNSHDITQKDELKAISAAKNIIENQDLKAFETLCEKSEFLFPFIRENIKKRLAKVINEENYTNLLTFLTIYSNDYSDTIISSLAKYANEDLTDEIYELLLNGSNAQKAYAAKYFHYIPDTIAQETLCQYAFSEEETIAMNAACTLGTMKDKISYEKAIELLKSKDDFEAIKGVKFLTAYGDKNAVKPILDCLQETSMPENVAGELLYLTSMKELLEYQDFYSALNCFDHILIGLGEILPLENLFCYEIYETLQGLILKNIEKEDSKIAQVLLRAWEKFDTLANNDEYIFDESKEIKQETKDIFAMLTSNGKDFIEEQKDLVIKELKQGKKRAQAAIEVIKELQITTAVDGLKEILEHEQDENLIAQIVGALKALGAIKDINKEDLTKKITDANLKALIESY